MGSGWATQFNRVFKPVLSFAVLLKTGLPRFGRRGGGG